AGVDVGGVRPGDVGDHDAAVHLVADQALALEGPGGLAQGAAGDAELGRDGGLAQRRARQQPARQDGLPDGVGGLLGGALPLDTHAQAGDRAGGGAGHGHQSPSGTSRPAPCSPASRKARAATAASSMPRPVRSATVSSSSAVRPASRPDATAVSSPYTEPGSSRPASRAWCSSPESAAPSRLSGTYLAAAARIRGSSSCLCGMSEPIAVTCAPRASQPCSISGVVLLVAVMTTSASPTASRTVGATEICKPAAVMSRWNCCAASGRRPQTVSRSIG